MYRCDECRKIFEQPKTIHEDRSPYGVSGDSSFWEEIECCPYCEGTWFEEFVEEEEEEDERD